MNKAEVRARLLTNADRVIAGITGPVHGVQLHNEECFVQGQFDQYCANFDFPEPLTMPQLLKNNFSYTPSLN